MVKERKQFAQNSAQVFNRGKRLKFPIGVQPVKQLSADQRLTARSSEKKLLESFKNLNETMRLVVMGDHAKDANRPKSADKIIQATGNTGAVKAEKSSTATDGVDAEETTVTPIKLFRSARGNVVPRRLYVGSTGETVNSGEADSILGINDHTASDQKTPKGYTPTSTPSIRLEKTYGGGDDEFVHPMSVDPKRNVNPLLKGGSSLVTTSSQLRMGSASSNRVKNLMRSAVAFRTRSRIPVRTITGAVKISSPADRHKKKG